VHHDPFRLGRRPAPVPYDPIHGGQPPAPGVAKPVLALVGIVVGADPTAIVEGFPGVEGARVVRTGDVVAGLRVARIGAREVTVVGMDTTWTLTVREPWR
jgi:hypothetical protein